jgi:PIN domain nuclease of toxin-antitoxin system
MSDCIVLDTHVLIWIVNGDAEQIKPHTREKVQAALKDGGVLIPAICVWEIGMLCKKERIRLAKPVSAWIRDALALTRFKLAPLNELIALEAATLPGDFHNDPADCLIVATARVENAVLLTRDQSLIEYGKAGHVHAFQV